MAKKKSNFFGGALLGGIVGAASYFLFGTEEGKKTQKNIKKESKKAYTKAEPTLKKLGDEAKKLIAQAQGKTTKTKSKSKKK